MLAAPILAPDAMKEAVRRFFDENEVWLARLLEDGRRARTLRFTGPVEEVARTLIASFEGAMLVAALTEMPVASSLPRTGWLRSSTASSPSSWSAWVPERRRLGVLAVDGRSRRAVSVSCGAAGLQGLPAGQVRCGGSPADAGRSTWTAGWKG
jgi:hypothetical protein